MVKKNITYLVFRNTSTLDYSIPYLCKLKEENREFDITILYCVFNRKHIIRDAKYYDDIFLEYNINQIDFGDLLSIKNHLIKAVLKKIFSISPNDVIGVKSFLKNPLFFNGKSPYYVLHKYKNKIQQYLMDRYLDISNILNSLNPDLILFDHRGKNKVFFPKERLLLDFINKKNIKVVLIPHANHQLGETDEYEPFALGNDKFPNFCDHWSSSNYVKPYLKVESNQREQFAHIGYPGTDSSWINKSIKKKRKKEVNILIISRRITAKYYPETEPDNIIVGYSRYVEYMNKINSELCKLDIDFKLIIKPHPSSSYPEMIRALDEANIDKYEITYEPFFKLMLDIDIVITEFTTSIAFPVLYKIPVILVYTPLLDSIYRQWDILEDLYANMKYYTNSFDSLSWNVQKALNDKDYLTEEDNRFREFYPDGAIERAIRRTKYLLKEDNND